MKYKKLGLFITQAFENEVLFVTSCALRKSLSKPKLISTWISVLFMVGASLFALASLCILFPSLELSNSFINLTYFVGSIFFTSAAYLQYLESINADITNKHHLCSNTGKYEWFKLCPYNLGYISSLTQFIGTLFFNINTFDMVLHPSSVYANNLFIWTPNILGSILFLSSAFFAWLEIYHDNHLRAFRSYTWWIVWINILGSVFFMVSALYSFNFSTGADSFFNEVAVTTTLLGAICFFIAAFLLHFEKDN